MFLPSESSVDECGGLFMHLVVRFDVSQWTEVSPFVSGDGSDGMVCKEMRRHVHAAIGRGLPADSDSV